jgi:hypothetical protein
MFYPAQGVPRKNGNVNQYLQNRTKEKKLNMKEKTTKQCPTLQAD